MSAFFVPFFTVASLQFLAVVAPGPDFALVAKNALLYPRRQAVYTAAGIALGLCVHISYCILGVAIIIVQSHWLFNLIKYLGASYLIYIGIQSWLTRTPAAKTAAVCESNSINVPTPRQALRQGFLCNLLNPKATLFLLGLFSLVIKPDTALWQQLIYGVWMASITFAWFALIACLITHPRARNKITHMQYATTRVISVFFITMGVLLLFFIA